MTRSRVRRSTGRLFLGLVRVASRCRDKAFSELSAGAFAGFGSNSVVQLPVRLKGEERITVGSDVFVGAGSWLNTIGSDGAGIEIGDGTCMSGGCVVSAVESVRLGRRVLLARGVYIADHSHAYGDADRAILDQGVTDVGRVVIGDGAWLGENVVVCPGVHIGEGAVIGANSVVTRDVPARALAVGAPARVVRAIDEPRLPKPEAALR